MLNKFIHRLFKTPCQWECRCDAGEEEHGINPGKRYCKICNKIQYSYYHRFGDTRIEWTSDTKFDW